MHSSKLYMMLSGLPCVSLGGACCWTLPIPQQSTETTGTQSSGPFLGAKPRNLRFGGQWCGELLGLLVAPYAMAGSLSQ